VRGQATLRASSGLPRFDEIAEHLFPDIAGQQLDRNPKCSRGAR
jgi:hypothetical protein